MLRKFFPRISLFSSDIFIFKHQTFLFSNIRFFQTSDTIFSNIWRFHFQTSDISKHLTFLFSNIRYFQTTDTLFSNLNFFKHLILSFSKLRYFQTSDICIFKPQIFWNIWHFHFQTSDIFRHLTFSFKPQILRLLCRFLGCSIGWRQILLTAQTLLRNQILNQKGILWFVRK